MPEPVALSPKRVLIVDDEPAMRETLSMLFRREGYEVVTAPGYTAATQLLTTAERPFPVVLTDLRMPDGDGFGVLDAAKKRSNATEVIVMTAYHEHAYDAMKRGAYDFVSKPFPSLREVLERVQKAYEKATIVAENQELRARVDHAHAPSSWIANSRAMQRVIEVVDKVAPTRATVLITGGSGTGKERIARMLHDKSDRASKPFMVLNCAALPENLMESELFGHEKGAFTGAAARNLGVLRTADGGTLLLDEVGDLPLSLQVKLLRVLQERKVRAVGSTVESDIDVRILAATNADIEALVANGRFRTDLYYRLNVIRIDLPPLHERKEDLPAMIDSFIRRFAREHDKPVRAIDKPAFQALEAYSFPGNVRELENIVERAVALADGAVITMAELPPDITRTTGPAESRSLDLPPEGCQLDEVLAQVERRLIVQALERSGSVRIAAAKLLGISFRSFRYRVAKLGIDSGDDPPESGVDDGPGSDEGREA